MLSQAPVFLARSIRRRSVPWRSFTKPLSVTSYMSSQFFSPSCIYSPRARRWLALESAPHPVTSLISSVLPRWELRYLSFSGVAGFSILNPDFFTVILLRAPTMGESGFFFTKKRRGKKVSWRIFSTTTNESPMSQIRCCINIHCDWIACPTRA